MNFASESKKILENMELQKMREDYDAELKRYRIQKHLIDVLKKIKVDQLKDVGLESKNNIAKAISWLHSIDFTKMENSGATVFGNFSHSEFHFLAIFTKIHNFQDFRRNQLIYCIRKRKHCERNWRKICRKQWHRYSDSPK